MEMTGIHWFVFLYVIGCMAIATALDTANLSKASVAVTKDTMNTSLLSERNGEDANNVSSSPDRKWDILEAFEDVYYPSLIALGSATNVLTLLVLMKSPRLYRTPASVYLCALAISDTLNLLSLSLHRQPPMSVENPFCSVAASMEHIRCPIKKYLDYVPVLLSSWFVLAFTLERFVAVRYPIRSISFCTKRKARIVLAVLCFSSMVFNAPLLFLVNSKPFSVSPDQKFPAATAASETMSKNTLDCLNIDAMNGSTISPKNNCETQEVTTTLDESMPRLEDSPTEMRRDGGRDHAENTNGCLHDCGPQYTPCMRETMCDFKKEYSKFSLVFSLVDMMLVFLLPSVAIVVLNLFIAATFWKESRRWSRVKPYLRISTSTFTSSINERTASILSKSRSLPNRTSLPPLMVLSPLPLLRPMESPAFQKEDIGPSPDSSPCGEVVASLEVVSDTASSQVDSTSSPPDSPSDNLLPASPEDFSYGPLGGHKHKKSRVTMGIGVKGAKVTGMLFVVSTAFVLLNLPAYAIRIYGLYIRTTVDRESESAADLATMHLAFPHAVAEVFYYTNFGINFFLYCIFGKNFRRSFNTQVCRLFRWLQTFVPCLRSISWPTRDQWSGQGVKTNSCKMDRRHRGESFTSSSRARTLTVTSEMSTRGFGRKGSS